MSDSLTSFAGSSVDLFLKLARALSSARVPLQRAAAKPSVNTMPKHKAKNEVSFSLGQPSSLLSSAAHVAPAKVYNTTKVNSMPPPAPMRSWDARVDLVPARALKYAAALATAVFSPLAPCELATTYVSPAAATGFTPKTFAPTYPAPAPAPIALDVFMSNRYTVT